MARRHDDGDGEKPSLTGRRGSLLNRRTFLTAAGAGVIAGAVGATGRSRAAEVDLGAQGLSAGDDIDPYLEEHFTSGNEVYIPPGEYRTELTWWDTAVSDAAIRGDPAGVELRRPEGFWTDQRMRFDGHVILENITFRGKLGHGRHRLRCEGQSGSARMEFRNVNDPDGSVGNSDAIFMRAEGRGRIDYKWLYLNEYPNSAFYQLDGEPRQVFEGCTFRNSTNIHRSGSDRYTVRNCLYISDGDAPDFCENDNSSEREDCANSGDAWGGMQRFFKFDGSHSISGLRFENLHYWCEDVPNNGFWMDFQCDQSNISGSMDGLYVYNASGQNLFRFCGQDVDVQNVHVSGPGNTSTPGFFDGVVTGGDATQPVRDAPVWTPNGEGHPLVDPNADPDQPTTTPDEPDEEEPDEEESEGAVFEIVSTSDDAELEYEFHVDGDAEPTTTDDGISSVNESNVTIAGDGDGTTTVTGKTGFGYGDAFEINSHVTTFDRTAGESDYALYLDGEDVTDQFSESDDDGQEPSTATFDVVSTGDQTELDYRFVVDGTAEPTIGEYGSAVNESEDQVSDNGDGTVTVTGNTGFGFGDAFEVTGTVESFERTAGESDYALYLDGEDVTDQFSESDDGSDGSDGPDDTGPKRIVVDGTEAPEEVNEYRVEVTGEVQPDPANSTLVDGGLAWDALADVVDGSTAVGVVGNGVDAYTYTGEVVDVDVKGNASYEVKD